MRIVNLQGPDQAGVGTVARLLQSHINELGHEMICVGTGRTAAERASGFDGVLLSTGTNDPLARTEAIVQYVREAEIDLVIANGLPVSSNALRFLPENVGRALVCHISSRFMYRSIKNAAPWVDAVIAPSPRLAEDVEEKCGVPEERVAMIPHGVEEAWLDEPVTVADPMRLVYVGRIEDHQKGVLWLPKILDCVRSRYAEVKMDIIGSGPDERALREKFDSRGLKGHITFHGHVNRDAIPGFLRQCSILVFPSRFEGFGLSLIEAMACGCVPVASRLRGITDAIVVDKETGYLCKAGNPREFGERIAELIGKPELLKQMSRASLERVKEKFVARRMAEDYIKLFSEIGKSICHTQKGLAMEQFQIYKGYNTMWYSWMPEWLKSMLRTFEARFRG